MKWLRRGDSGLSLPLFALAHAGIFAGLFRGIYSIPYSGTGLYYRYAGRILSGQLPYRDFVAEYPPLALAFFTLPRVIGESFRWYYVWFQTEIVVFDLLIVLALYLAARRWALPPFRLLAGYTIAVLAVGPIALQQFDIFPATFTLLAILVFASGWTVVSAVLLALGALTKLYPILIAPLFVLVAWREGRRREIWWSIAAFAATCVVVATPWLIAAPRSLAVLFNYHARRGIQIESLYASVAMIADYFAWSPVQVDFTFGSWNLAGLVPNRLARMSTAMLVAVLAAVYLAIDRRMRREGAAAARHPQFLGQAAALVVAGAMVASKVLSPQYLVWLPSLVALVAERRRVVVWSIFALAGTLTYFMYPFNYDSLLALQGYAIAIITIRNLVLVALVILLAQTLGASRNDTWPETSR